MGLLEEVEEPEILQIDRQSFHVSQRVVSVGMELLKEKKLFKKRFFGKNENVSKLKLRLFKCNYSKSVFLSFEQFFE